MAQVLNVSELEAITPLRSKMGAYGTSQNESMSEQQALQTRFRNVANSDSIILP